MFWSDYDQAQIFFQIVLRCYKRREGKLIYIANLSSIVRAQQPTSLGLPTNAGDVLHQICCSLCLIKFEALAEKADATSQLGWTATLVRSAEHLPVILASLEVFGEEHNHTHMQESWPQTAAQKDPVHRWQNIKTTLGHRWTTITAIWPIFDFDTFDSNKTHIHRSCRWFSTLN